MFHLGVCGIPSSAFSLLLLPLLIIVSPTNSVTADETTLTTTQHNEQQQQQQQNHRQQQVLKYVDCEPSTYYETISDLENDRQSLHKLIQQTHRTILPYTSSSKFDVWDALMDLDADPLDATKVHLLYKDVSFPAVPHGTAETWNREHVWPKSLGVGTNGDDFTDVHSLKPADWNVNAARSNRFFATCGIAHPKGECVIPAHTEAAVDTERDATTFLPPRDARGVVARAIFYMALRYDGDDNDSGETLNLTITDCPKEENKDHEMAYLSQLLEWHTTYPPSDAEKLRNDRVCKYWQGNRNPFIDFPDLVENYYGHPKSLLSESEGEGVLGYDCTISDHPTPSPSDGDDNNNNNNDNNNDMNSCMGLEPGDITIVGIHSDDPDTVVLVALADIAPNTILYITDNAWTGTEFRSNEGVIQLTVPSDGIEIGSIFGYSAAPNSQLYLSDNWQKSQGSFQLSTSGDSVIVYCANTGDQQQNNGANKDIMALAAVSYSSTGFQPANPNNPSSFETSDTALPPGLPENTFIDFTTGGLIYDNYVFVGPRVGTKQEILENISSPSNWDASNSKLDITSMQDEFFVYNSFFSTATNNNRTNNNHYFGSCIIAITFVMVAQAVHYHLM